MHNHNKKKTVGPRSASYPNTIRRLSKKQLEARLKKEMNVDSLTLTESPGLVMNALNITKHLMETEVQCFKENLGDVEAATNGSFTILSWALQPGLPDFLPWLARGLGASFAKYLMHRATFLFRTTIPTNDAADVIMGWLPDATQPLPRNMEEATLCSKYHRFNANSNGVLHIDFDDFHDDPDSMWKYTRAGVREALNTFDMGTFFVAIDGETGINDSAFINKVGEIECAVDCQFKEKQEQPVTAELEGLDNGEVTVFQRSTLSEDMSVSVPVPLTSNWFTLTPSNPARVFSASGEGFYLTQGTYRIGMTYRVGVAPTTPLPTTPRRIDVGLRVASANAEGIIPSTDIAVAAGGLHQQSFPGINGTFVDTYHMQAFAANPSSDVFVLTITDQGQNPARTPVCIIPFVDLDADGSGANDGAFIDSDLVLTFEKLPGPGRGPVVGRSQPSPTLLSTDNVSYHEPVIPPTTTTCTATTAELPDFPPGQSLSAAKHLARCLLASEK